MKTGTVVLLFALIINSAISQNAEFENPATYKSFAKDSVRHNNQANNLWYEIHPVYKTSITQEKLAAAKHFSEISEGYPKNWLNEYVSTEIKATSGGKSMKASGTNDILTLDQINILKTIGIGSSFEINNMYKTKNSATDKIEIRTMSYSVTVIPEVEAAYHGGQQKLMTYLKENVISKIPENMKENGMEASIRFTINEAGEVTNSKIRTSSKDTQTDKILLDALGKMPKWKPAENSKGEKVKQDFEFWVGNGGC